MSQRGNAASSGQSAAVDGGKDRAWMVAHHQKQFCGGARVGHIVEHAGLRGLSQSGKIGAGTEVVPAPASMTTRHLDRRRCGHGVL